MQTAPPTQTKERTPTYSIQILETSVLWPVCIIIIYNHIQIKIIIKGSNTISYLVIFERDLPNELKEVRGITLHMLPKLLQGRNIRTNKKEPSTES